MSHHCYFLTHQQVNIKSPLAYFTTKANAQTTRAHTHKGKTDVLLLPTHLLKLPILFTYMLDDLNQ